MLRLSATRRLTHRAANRAPDTSSGAVDQEDFVGHWDKRLPDHARAPAAGGRRGLRGDGLPHCRAACPGELRETVGPREVQLSGSLHQAPSAANAPPTDTRLTPATASSFTARNSHMTSTGIYRSQRRPERDWSGCADRRSSPPAGSAVRQVAPLRAVGPRTGRCWLCSRSYWAGSAGRRSCRAATGSGPAR